MTRLDPLAQTLRSLPVLTATPVPFAIDRALDDPMSLFDEWLREAIVAGVTEPHAMTLSTVDADGLPDARVLILKDVNECGLWFATSCSSAKGRQLDARGVAAVTIYWPALGRSVRARGRTRRGSEASSVADFRERGFGARAVALASHESSPLASLDECDAAVTTARAALLRDPTLISSTWTLYVLAPEQVEFWQADPDRQHIRLRYTRINDGWQHGLLWP
jgi:pyridoxamine 5'-phosphate oxidase